MSFSFDEGCTFTAMEELMAQVKDKDYLIQQQADEIERLRRDVKKQQEKMIELAKGLPKRGEWIVKGANRIDCSVCGHSVCFAFGLSEGSLNLYKYCPECGAKMEVQE